MPRATTCLFENREIGIDEALRFRDDGGRTPTSQLLCVECKERVKAHRSGGSGGAHFEHFRRNSDCSRSVP